MTADEFTREAASLALRAGAGPSNPARSSIIDDGVAAHAAGTLPDGTAYDIGAKGPNAAQVVLMALRSLPAANK